jgi:hypothetical protein
MFARSGILTESWCVAFYLGSFSTPARSTLLHPSRYWHGRAINGTHRLSGNKTTTTFPVNCPRTRFFCSRMSSRLFTHRSRVRHVRVCLAITPPCTSLLEQMLSYPSLCISCADQWRRRLFLSTQTPVPNGTGLEAMSRMMEGSPLCGPTQTLRMRRV